MAKTLNVIYDDFGVIKYSIIAVEEKEKIYKTTDRCTPRCYLSTIRKSQVNNMYEDSVLIYDCSKEEAIEIWNKHKDKQIEMAERRLKELKALKIEV